ncbi:hypothetical protein KL921_002684 [Ogataea angusta]|uniref:Putative tyrosine-protein phosphatase OCA1 n=1 Tax=Pichia angusta TaxID=870730 RepID=A0AAN6DI39_PICAN|nr:uncharacterized protein KL928_001604 [Ogataea angusta]KAG7811056.1 hypothetical protein KL921_002684 [Ogataea angusta]KAG7820167.1 hypothetical protein KL928_001604 [Ogataea angusta]KAG7823849.1 hypothetical protein KL909_002586 [Ogataea angusta]KAG7829539.1 hypothetical protein KL920_002398 [Ogataea angusta]KAG7838402.1 hypothetical protein KL943_000478 [Ogataea angusta]
MEKKAKLPPKGAILIDQLPNNAIENELRDDTVVVKNPPSLRIVPPINFCPVEKHLYRSGQPSAINHSFLEQLHLKSVIWLATEEPQDTFLRFMEENDINLFCNLGYDSIDSNSWDGLSESSIKQALEIISDKRHYPLLVCCGMGRHRTGTVIGCLRKLQGWNLASVSEEYRRFTGVRGGRILVELLIEAFDVSTIETRKEVAPEWLLR